ncbi:MAG: hypothetical protein M1348_00515 [Candidatus Parvarchaeota archaeon]|jgi:hypothetical protein|nr:hypothetical protein [Candidatus Parvarchaeota archaeon]
MRFSYYVILLIILFVGTGWYILSFSTFFPTNITNITGFSGVIVTQGSVSSNSGVVDLTLLNREPFSIVLNGSYASVTLTSPRDITDPVMKLNCTSDDLSPNSSTTCVGKGIPDGSAIVNMTIDYTHYKNTNLIINESYGKFDYALCTKFSAVCE